jgi:hypothetical protein
VLSVSAPAAARSSIDGVAGLSGAASTMRARQSATLTYFCVFCVLAASAAAPPVKQGLLSLLKLPGAGEADAARGRGSCASAELLLRSSNAARFDSRPPPPPPQKVTAPLPASATAAATGAKSFLEQAKQLLSREEYLQVRPPLRTLWCGLRANTPLRRRRLDARVPQFQSLLKAFKSEAVCFETLLEGASSVHGVWRYNSSRHDVGATLADVALILRAATDPALFGMFGAFVPAHHQVCGPAAAADNTNSD